MEDSEVRNNIEKPVIHPQYILIGSETLIMDRTIQTIKEQLKIDVSFDFDVFSLSEIPFDEVLAKLYSSAFMSSRRLIVAKNLEELDQKGITAFADVIQRTPTQNCLIITYLLSKNDRKTRSTVKKLQDTFNRAKCVTYRSDKTQVRNWIAAKVKKDGLPLSSAMMQYLEEEFSNDITGLKNEFDKIENYLAEVRNISSERMQDLAQGLCDFNTYQVVDSFLKGDTRSIVLFEELLPYLRSYLEVVGALTWSLINHALRNNSVLQNTTMLQTLLRDVADIDKGIKTGSIFSQTKLELFFLKNAQLFRKGAVYG